MRHVLKGIARTFWRRGAPLRRPITRKVSALLADVVSRSVRDEVAPRIDPAIAGISLARTEVGTYRNETNLLLDGLVREMCRLGDEVESLRAEVAAIRDPRAGRAVRDGRRDEAA